MTFYKPEWHVKIAIIISDTEIAQGLKKVRKFCWVLKERTEDNGKLNYMRLQYPVIFLDFSSEQNIERKTFNFIDLINEILEVCANFWSNNLQWNWKDW